MLNKIIDPSPFCYSFCLLCSVFIVVVAVVVLLFFAFLFHILFLLSSTLIISIFYSLNYTLLLLDLITAHLVSYLSLSSIIFSTSGLIISIFYSRDCILLSLHNTSCNRFYNINVISICPRQLVWFISLILH